MNNLRKIKDYYDEFWLDKNKHLQEALISPKDYMLGYKKYDKKWSEVRYLRRKSKRISWKINRW